VHSTVRISSHTHHYRCSRYRTLMHEKAFPGSIGSARTYSATRCLHVCCSTNLIVCLICYVSNACRFVTTTACATGTEQLEGRTATSCKQGAATPCHIAMTQSLKACPGGDSTRNKKPDSAPAPLIPALFHCKTMHIDITHHSHQTTTKQDTTNTQGLQPWWMLKGACYHDTPSTYAAIQQRRV
jgi:hypothetical protein